MRFGRTRVPRNRTKPRCLFQAIEALEGRTLFTTTTLGIDVSSAVSNWNTLRNSDNEQFCYVQSSYGGSVGQSNSYWANDVSSAKAANFPIGVYHFAYPASSTAVAEADYFYSVAGSAMKPGNLPPMLDIEETGNDGSSNPSAWVNAFCNELKAKSGVTPIVYTYSSFASSYFTSSVTQWPLWIANYDGNSSPENVSSGPWSSSAWTIHQYAGTTSLSGDSVDLNAFKGTLSQLQAFEIQSTTPSITVKDGSTTITKGQSTKISFGTANLGTASPGVTFTVSNTGGGTLTTGSLTVPSGYSITNSLSSSIGAGSSDTFTVAMSTSTAGTFSGNVSFTNNVSGQSPFTFPITGTVVDPTPTAPSNLQITGYTSNSVTMTWSDNSNNETSFEIDRKTGAGGTYAAVASLAANTNTWTDSASTDSSNVPTPGTTYYYRVRAINGSYFSSYATEQSVTTLANVPTGVWATDGTLEDRVTISWNAAQGADVVSGLSLHQCQRHAAGGWIADQLDQ